MQTFSADHEPERLRALYQYNILDSPTERSFDDLVRVATWVCGTPFGAISFVDEKRQWFKSHYGIEISETPREVAFCSHTILHHEPFVIEDATIDPRFSLNPLVTGMPNLRFYAGVPLTTPDGQNLGALCVLDVVSRKLSAAQLNTLEILARQVIAQLELKRTKTELEASNEELFIAFSGLVRAHFRVTGRQDQLVKTEKMATLGEMASMLVHEINNPLMVLQMTTESVQEMVQTNTLDREELLLSFNSIEKTISRITKIIKSTRSFSRQSDRDPFQQVSLKTIIENIQQLCEKKITAQGISLRLPEIPGDLSLDCRESEITQVFVNLLNNAADAVVSLEEKWIQLDAHFAGNEIELIVTDSGPGIPSKIRDQIFQPFFSTKPKDSGTGLGLSISKRIIESHKGQLRLDPKSQKTRFIITLPLHQIR